LIRSLSLVATAITIALASAATSPAADDEQAKALVGSWLVAPENGAKGCRLSLEMAETIGGRVIAGAQACAAALPVLAGATAWKLGSDDTLRIIDVNRKELLRFGQEEGSPWETEEGEPMWLLPALGDLDHVPSVESLVGTWQLKNQSGEALCQIDLTAEDHLPRIHFRYEAQSLGNGRLRTGADGQRRLCTGIRHECIGQFRKIR
jgi:hypothetical protein